MKVKRNIKKILAIGIGALVCFGALAGCTVDKTPFAQGDVDKLVEEAEDLKDSDIAALNAQIIDITADLNEKDLKILKDAEKLADLQDDKDEAEAAKLAAEEDAKLQAVEDAKYVLDDISIGTTIAEDISDREVGILLDTEIDFDGDDYDVEEVLNLDGLKVEVNGQDYEGKPYLTIPEEGITYKYVIDSALDTSEISEDEPLKIDLLGKSVEIVNWDVDEVTFNEGTEYVLYKDDTVVINDKIVKIELIGEDFIYVDVAGEKEKIKEGDTEEVNGIEIFADEVLYSEKYNSIATVKIGEEVSTTIKDGEEYADDSVWEYVIDANSIGVKLVEEFVNVDEDEDNKALAEGKTIVLPEGYLTVEFEGLTVEDTEDYTFDTTTKSSVDYLRVKGEFLNGINDYEKVYINCAGEILDEDFVLIGTDVELGNTDVVLDTSSGKVVIDDIEIELDLSDIVVDGDSLVDEEDDYTTSYGIVLNNPEDSIDDEKLKITVPEEEVEAIVKVY